MGSSLVAINGSEVWAYVVETDEGYRIQFSLDDWDRLRIGPGQRVPVRLPGKDDVWLFAANTTPLPPIVWVTMTARMRVAG